MGVEEIVARIEQDAADEEARIEKEAAEEEERLLAERQAAAEKEAAAIVAAGKQEAAALRRRTLARARLAARGHLRAAREAGIDRTFEEAERRLAALTDADAYPAVLERLIAGGREILGGGAVTVLCREEDRPAVTAACGRIEDAAVETFDGDDGGVVVIAGQARCDQRFHARLARMREGLTERTAAILFRENGHDHP